MDTSEAWELVKKECTQFERWRLESYQFNRAIYVNFDTMRSSTKTDGMPTLFLMVSGLYGVFLCSVVQSFAVVDAETLQNWSNPKPVDKIPVRQKSPPAEPALFVDKLPIRRRKKKRPVIVA